MGPRGPAAEARPWPRAMKLQSEKEVIGFYLSDHPLAGLDKIYKIWVTTEIAGLKDEPADKRVVVAGLITSLREIISKKGSRMAFGQLEDLSGSVELIVFPEAFAKGEMALKADAPLLVGGNLKKENDSFKILVDRVAPLEEVLGKSKSMTLKIDSSMREKLSDLQHLLSRFPGKTGVEIEMQIELDLDGEAEQAEAAGTEASRRPVVKKTITMDVADPQGVMVTNAFFEDLHGLFGHTDFIEIRG